MFGYVKPLTCSLTEDEQVLYKSIYCGLCHALGRIAGQGARITLSYDFVFLALIRMAALGEQPLYHTIHCVSHPFNGCPAVLHSPTLDYCAALSVLLGYESIQDHLQDEKGISRFAAQLKGIPMRSYRNRASKTIDLPDRLIKQYLIQLSKIEKDCGMSPDTPSEIFGNLLADISAYGIEDDMMHFAVSKIMFHLGKWIYLIDAADDFKEDKQKNRYNPFMPSGPDPLVLQNALEWELSHCDDILRKMPISDLRIRHIIRNILYNGTAQVTKTVLFPGGN